MNSRQRGTLAAIFETPTRADIDWDDVVSLLSGLGAEVSEGRGSRVRVALNGIRAVFHRPHPRKVTDKGAVKSVREFLVQAGVTP
ncbi:MAG: type II toxin-antitoxin system HicA family toxin [bacterium]|nr:type II toxin-antitoxin system HicA family toxin [bacterium]